MLYSHFPGGKDETLAAVALEGFAALGDALREAFAVLRDTLGGDDAAEVGWATLHGLATLRRAGRLPGATEARRRERAVALLT